MACRHDPLATAAGRSLTKVERGDLVAQLPHTPLRNKGADPQAPRRFDRHPPGSNRVNQILGRRDRKDRERELPGPSDATPEQKIEGDNFPAAVANPYRVIESSRTTWRISSSTGRPAAGGVRVGREQE